LFIIVSFLQKLFSKTQKKIEPEIIPAEVHKINGSLIDFNALKIINRLKKFGFEAYIVGGALRDYLLGHKPKDFDVVTNATPKEIKKIFTNGRIIGRRFKLVHIIFGNNYIEVATFRAKESKKNSDDDPFMKENNFGNIEDDVVRRDFSINALYYDPVHETIIDYVNGFSDIKSKTIRPLNPPEMSFLEDPVRMLRAVKYKALLDCKIEENVVKKIVKYSKELTKTSTARLHEEINKILRSGKSKGIFLELSKFNLLKYLIPFLDEDFASDKKDSILSFIEKYDEQVSITKFHNFDMFWGIILYQRLLNAGFDSKDFTYIQKVNDFFIGYLFPLKVPNKVSDVLSKSFYLFNKLQDTQSQTSFRKYINHKYFIDALFLLKVLSSNEALIKFWDTNKNKIFKKPKPKNKSVNKNQNGFKKVIMTKNYVTPNTVSEKTLKEENV